MSIASRIDIVDIHVTTVKSCHRGEPVNRKMGRNVIRLPSTPDASPGTTMHIGQCVILSWEADLRLPLAIGLDLVCKFECSERRFHLVPLFTLELYS